MKLEREHRLAVTIPDGACPAVIEAALIDRCRRLTPLRHLDDFEFEVVNLENGFGDIP
jgi:hypothetical protein